VFPNFRSASDAEGIVHCAAQQHLKSAHTLEFGGSQVSPPSRIIGSDNGQVPKVVSNRPQSRYPLRQSPTTHKVGRDRIPASTWLDIFKVVNHT